MAAVKGFEKLDAYRLTEDLADRVWDAVGGWRPLAQDTVGRQLIRAADSIGANIAEGAGRGTYKDNRRFIDVARGPLNGTRHFLRRAYRRKLLVTADSQPRQRLLRELGPRLNAYRTAIRRRSRTHRPTATGPK